MDNSFHWPHNKYTGEGGGADVVCVRGKRDVAIILSGWEASTFLCPGAYLRGKERMAGANQLM
jgi:hypothetical protein